MTDPAAPYILNGRAVTTSSSTATHPQNHTTDPFEIWIDRRVAELRRICNLVRVEKDYKDDKLLTARIYETHRRGDHANMLE